MAWREHKAAFTIGVLASLVAAYIHPWTTKAWPWMIPPPIQREPPPKKVPPPGPPLQPIKKPHELLGRSLTDAEVQRFIDMASDHQTPGSCKDFTAENCLYFGPRGFGVVFDGADTVREFVFRADPGEDLPLPLPIEVGWTDTKSAVQIKWHRKKCTPAREVDCWYEGGDNHQGGTSLRYYQKEYWVEFHFDGRENGAHLLEAALVRSPDRYPIRDSGGGPMQAAP
jgi:hypothetical protein